MPNQCAIHNCTRNQGTLKFPKDEYMRQLWAEKVQLNKKNFQPNDSNVICELHFTEEDFEILRKVQNI